MSSHTVSSRNSPQAARTWFKPILAVIGFCGLLMLAGCSSNDTAPTSAQSGAPATEQHFDADSWKSMISKNCQRFSDGCNNCVRNMESGVAACTRKACVAYTKPECMDEMISGAASAEPKTVTYQCESDHRLEVSYGRYVHDEKTVELQPGQIILRDLQTGTAHLLNRVRSASGERYQGDDLEFWSKGKDGMLRRRGQPLYLSCVTQ